MKKITYRYDTLLALCYKLPTYTLCYLIHDVYVITYGTSRKKTYLQQIAKRNVLNDKEEFPLLLKFPFTIQQVIYFSISIISILH